MLIESLYCRCENPCFTIRAKKSTDNILIFVFKGLVGAYALKIKIFFGKEPLFGKKVSYTKRVEKLRLNVFLQHFKFFPDFNKGLNCIIHLTLCMGGGYLNPYSCLVLRYHRIEKGNYIYAFLK